MKIKQLSCTQFAGIVDRSISFGDGINLIYGKNESGKSTLVNLLSRTLFQNAKLNGRKDKEFKELYFPSARKDGGTAGDFADGKLTFAAEKGTYTLSKEWGPDSRCTLATPDGVIRSQSEISAILKEVLLYGEGVYADLLLSSQRNADISLQTLLDAAKNTDAKQEIVSVLSQAFAESDGVTADAIEQAIQGKIDEIAGKHWDAERGMPVRKAGRWGSGLGIILKAYYDWEDAKNVLGEIQAKETAADTAAAAYTVRDQETAAAEEALDRFQTYSGQLILQEERRKAIARLERELEKFRKDLEQWPQLAADLEKVKALQTQQEQRALLDRYHRAKAVFGQIDTLRRELGDGPCPELQEITAVKAAQKKITALENKLCGMNLAADLRLFGDHTLRVTSLRTGETVEAADGTLNLTEAVNITIPGVMEMQLAPANVDVTKVEADMEAQKHGIRDIFVRYAVDSLEALEQLKNRLTDGRRNLDSLSQLLTAALNGTRYEELEAAVKEVSGEVPSQEEIRGDILALCGRVGLVSYLAAKETIVSGYAREYGSMDSLKARTGETEQELQRAREAVQAVQDIPAEYMGIANPEAHLANLQSQLKTQRSLREAALTNKTNAARDLENYKEGLNGDPQTNAEAAQRDFLQAKTLLAHWTHIGEVFAQQRQKVQNAPMQDIADSFTRYLGMISGGTVSSEFPDRDKLNMSIYSGKNLLDYSKLSEGTKETVSLAFRLAVLDHLFPQGGGIIVLDDPFTDMDADRTAQSCQLLKECATRHQVIFLTCKEEYTDLLGGTLIRI